MSQSITDYLKDNAYPQLDAVDAGFFDHLKPSSLTSSGSYVLVCPSCGEREGYYYPTKSHIVCNRKNKCGKATSVWDVLASNGYQPRDIVKMICDKAGVPVPERDRQQASGTSSSTPANSKPTMSPGKAIFSVTQALARKNPGPLKKLQADRKYSDEAMESMRLGYYSTPDEVLEGLLSLGITREVAIEKGYIEVDKNDPNKLLKGTSNRIVGYWPHPDKDVRLWGRLAEGAGDKFNPKYRFAPGLSKEIPYLFQQRKPTILCTIEGAFDAWTLSLMGYWVACVGGDRVTEAQAAYLASQSVSELVTIIDGDAAGYEGAVSTIRNCESVGITVYVVPLGKGMDDPDALRKSGNTETLERLISARMNSGEFLARLASAYANQSAPNLRSMRRIITASEALTPVSRHKWKDFKGSLALPDYNQSKALKLLAGLVDAGLSFEEASSRVFDLTRYEFTVKEPIDG